MSDATWREGWGYAGMTAPRARKDESVNDADLAPKVSMHSRWARMSEIQSRFVRCDLHGKDTVVEKGGFPVWSDGSVSYIDTSPNHVLIVAATNRHKTRGALMPAIAVTALERNVSYVIHDPKGELYRHLSGMMRELGIEVKVVNFRDPERGDCWNMLSVPYRLWKGGNVSAAKAMLTDIAALLSPIDTKTSNDLFWPSAGQYTLLGFLYALMELSHSEEEANFSNLISIIRSATVDADTFSAFVGRFDSDSDVATMLSSAVNNAENTRRCIMGMVYNSLAKLICNESLASMMASNQMDLAEMGVKPTAVFLITPDEKNTYNPLVGQFVSQSYQELIAKAQSLGGTLPLRVNFILDEFASLDRIEGIPDMLAAGRSRNIRCMIVIQSVAQLRAVYDNITPSIKNNCADWIYLGGRDIEFMDELCTLAGRDSNGNPLVTNTQLMHLEKGREAFVLIDGCYPFVGRIADISEYDLGDLTFSEPELRTDHRMPVVKGSSMYEEYGASEEPFQYIFEEPPGPKHPSPIQVDTELGPKTYPIVIQAIASEFGPDDAAGNRRMISLLTEFSRMLEVPVRVRMFMEELDDVRTVNDMTELMNGLMLRNGVTKTSARETLKQIKLLM